jgi:hypothetical protein
MGGSALAVFACCLLAPVRALLAARPALAPTLRCRPTLMTAGRGRGNDGGDEAYSCDWVCSWLKLPPALSVDTAPSARLVAPRAQAAPTHPRAPPEQPGGWPWPRLKVEDFQPPGRGLADGALEARSGHAGVAARGPGAGRSRTAFHGEGCSGYRDRTG